MKYKIWNKIDNLYTPSGRMFTAEQIKTENPLALLANVTFIICDAPINMGVFMEFTQTKEVYKKMGAAILDTMTDQEVLDKITEFEERVIIQEPTAEERLAAAAEFENLIKL